jgi:hypothetical protein
MYIFYFSHILIVNLISLMELLLLLLLPSLYFDRMCYVFLLLIRAQFVIGNKN